MSNSGINGAAPRGVAAVLDRSAPAEAAHNDAASMLSDAERAMADIRFSLQYDPKTAFTAPPRKPAVVTLPVTRERGPMLRVVAAVSFAAALAGIGGVLMLPSVNTSAKLQTSSGETTAAVIEAAETPNSGASFVRPSTADTVSRMYADEFSKSDKASLRCLAEAVYFEARGEPYIGQVAVAQVVLNRARSGKWSRSICGVITQGIERGEKCQFSYMCRMVRATPVGAMWDQAQEVAIDAARGRVWLRELVEATHYHTTAVHPVWRQSLDQVAQFGSHIFYRQPDLAFALSVAKAIEPRVHSGPETEARSHQSTSANVESDSEFKLPAGTVPTPGFTPPPPPKPRPVARVQRGTDEAAAPAAKGDADWVARMRGN